MLGDELALVDDRLPLLALGAGRPFGGTGLRAEGWASLASRSLSMAGFGTSMVRTCALGSRLGLFCCAAGVDWRRTVLMPLRRPAVSVPPAGALIGAELGRLLFRRTGGLFGVDSVAIFAADGYGSRRLI